MFVISIFAEQKGLMIRLLKESYKRFNSDDLPQMEKFGGFVEEYALKGNKKFGQISYSNTEDIFDQIMKKAFPQP